MTSIQTPPGIDLSGAVIGEHAEVVTPEALEFFAALHREFNPRRLELLRERKFRQAAIDKGERPTFLAETRHIRERDWRVDPVRADLQDRRVEITGPVDRKMVINALNCGAKCYMADFEDAHSPTWSATLDGQINVRDAVRGTIEYFSPEGKRYELKDKVATLLVRPRGWHLPEKHVRVDGRIASASLFDFAMYFFHNARYRVEHGSGVYLYLPKLQSYLEARLWNDVFVRAQELLGLPQGSVKATVLIEHILAAFQMEEILYELRHHSAGLNCGRWDYIFSYIKTFARRKEFLVPDRAQVTMTTPFMRAYSLACIETCHKRGAFAMGGMSAYIPVKSDPAANEKALQKVREDKRREATDGHDGTWVAHPGLVPVALEEFDRVLSGRANQIAPLPTNLSASERGSVTRSTPDGSDALRVADPRSDARGEGEELLEVPKGTITEEGVRGNIRVAIQYLDAWLGGLGCVPLYNLMEDAATAEISRTQVWHWIHHPRAILEDGRKVTLALIRQFMQEELEQIPDRGHRAEATEIFDDLISSNTLEEFLTLKAYEMLD